MLRKTDTYQMIRDKLEKLASEIWGCKKLHKRKYKGQMTNDKGLANKLGKLYRMMEEDHTEISDIILNIFPDRDDNEKFNKGDFVYWNTLWSKYKKMKELYNENQTK